MGAFLRQMVDTHTEMTAFLLSLATRGADRRRLRRHHHSDAEVVMSDLATTVSDLGTASARVIKRQSTKSPRRGDERSTATRRATRAR